MEAHTLQLGNFVTVYIYNRAPFSFHSGHWVETAVLWENAPPAQSLTHCMIHTLRWPEAFFSPTPVFIDTQKKGLAQLCGGNYVLIWWNEWWAAIKKNTATPWMKASGLQATWLIVSWMRADVRKMGNDRWTHPPLINICNGIMRLNSARTKEWKKSCNVLAPSHEKCKWRWLNGVQGQIFCHSDGISKLNLPPRLAPIVYKWICFSLSPRILAEKYGKEKKKKSCACHRFSPRHLRFNCGDMNAIFVSAALKLNGRTAAIGEWVLGSVSSKLSASLIELPPLPVCSIHFQCKFNFTLFHLDNQLSISTAFWGNQDYKYLYMKANTLQRTTQDPWQLELNQKAITACKLFT